MTEGKIFKIITIMKWKSWEFFYNFEFDIQKYIPYRNQKAPIRGKIVSEIINGWCFSVEDRTTKLQEY